MPIDSQDNEDLLLSEIEEKKEIEALTGENLTVCVFGHCTEQDTLKCRKCQRNFCIMHANRFSPNFCKDCFSNLACIEDKFTRTFEDYDAKHDKMIVTNESCTRYYMDGPDWPFLTAWIDSLTDDQLRAIWNFHFFVMKTIEAENEVRKIKKSAKLREYKVEKQVSTTKTTKVKSVTTKTVQVDTAEELRKKFKKQGLPDAIIDQMITAMGVK